MESINLGDADAWDDSALVESWNGALREYKKYHSIHAKGENVEEVLDRHEAAQQNNPDPQHSPQTAQTAVEQMVEDVTSRRVTDPGAVRGQGGSDTVPAADQTISGDHLRATQTPNACDAPPGESLATSAAPGSGPAVAHEARNVPASTQVPQSLMGNVQDEALKSLMMSWYYAGYYTGLYEGQQRAVQAAAAAAAPASSSEAGPKDQNHHGP